MTKLNRMWALMGVLVLLSPLAARAASIEPQSIELDTRFSFDHNSISIDDPDIFAEDIDFSITTIEMQAGIGYFFNSHWELLGNLVVDHLGFGGDADGSITDFGLTADALYHFNTSGSVIPFVGAGLGFVIHGGDLGDDEDDTTLIVPELLAGVRWPFRDVVSLNLTGGYRHEDSPAALLGGSYEDGSGNDFFIAFGFSFFLQGGAAQ
ncbi:MAG TPA: outer membrane beta-barrel protein [Candidatus Krumholzibacteria bacterium]